MSQQEQIEQLQGQVMELRAIIYQLLGPAGEFLLKRDTTLGVKDTKIVLGAAGSRVAFFGGTPVSKNTSSESNSDVIEVTAGGTMNRADRFDGGLGGTHYNFSDVVRRLIELGLMAP